MVSVVVSGVHLIEAADNPRPVHKLSQQTQHPKQDHPWLLTCFVGLSTFSFGLSNLIRKRMASS